MSGSKNSSRAPRLSLLVSCVVYVYVAIAMAAQNPPQKEAANTQTGDDTDPGVALAEFCASHLDDYTPTVNLET